MEFEKNLRSFYRWTPTETSLGLVSNLLHVVKLPQRAQEFDYLSKFVLWDSKAGGHREVIELPVWKEKNIFIEKPSFILSDRLWTSTIIKNQVSAIILRFWRATEGIWHSR